MFVAILEEWYIMIIRHWIHRRNPHNVNVKRLDTFQTQGFEPITSQPRDFCSFLMTNIAQIGLYMKKP